MITQLDHDSIKTKGLSLPEAVLLLFFNYEQASAQVIHDLMQRGLLKRTSVQEITKTGVKYRLTSEGEAVLQSCLIASEKPKHIEVETERLSKLAKCLKEIYPKGRKEGTNTYWTEGNALIIKRLKLFFKKYGADYTDEQIIQATKSYVESFNGDYRFMRVLKYFIFKEEKGADGMVESTSDLINRIDNAGQEDTENNNWMNAVR